MNIFELRQAYEEGKLTKQDFIEKMHCKHLILNDYANYLKSTEIKKILIENEKVFFVSNEDIFFRCNFIDKGIPLVNLSAGEYEKEELRWVINLIHDDDIIFDIGANYGWYSLNISKRYKNTRIHAFEPIEDTFEILSQNVRINNADNVEIYNIGLGEKDKIVEFNYNRDQSGATSMVNLLNRDDAEKIKCPIRTLDSFILEKRIDKVDFIKCDVEGAEFFVLHGSKNVLEQHRPKLFIEMLRKWAKKFNYHPNDIIQYMSDLGYFCFEITKGKLCLFETMTDDVDSTNFFFLHEEKHSSIIKRYGCLLNGR